MTLNTEIMVDLRLLDQARIQPLELALPSRSLTAHRNGVGNQAELRCGVLVQADGFRSVDYSSSQLGCCLIACGSGHYRDELGKHPLFPGRAFMQLPNRRHDIYLEGHSVWFYFAVPAAAIEMLKSSGLHSALKKDAVFDPMFDQVIIEKWLSLIKKLSVVPSERLSLVMVEIMQLMIDLHLRTENTLKMPQHREAIEQACRLLESDLRAELSMPELAESVGLKYNTFRSAFSKHKGLSPQAWRMQHRLDKAKQELIETSLLIATIAHQLGWLDPLDFSRCFSRHFGCSPSQFRAEALTGKERQAALAVK